MQTGAELIAEERARQIIDKGYTPEHDEQHKDGELAAAAISYTAEALGLKQHGVSQPLLWPWDPKDWKPEDSQLENLIKAGAFLAAEIDRIQADVMRRMEVVK
jgi:hypothetical protein